MTTIERRVIVEQLGRGVTTKTQVQVTRVIYQVLIDDVVQWQRTALFSRHKGNQKDRECIARAQDTKAKELYNARA